MKQTWIPFQRKPHATAAYFDDGHWKVATACVAIPYPSAVTMTRMTVTLLTPTDPTVASWTSQPIARVSEVPS